jgi:DNA-binding response OmpR family regulator
MALAEDLRVLTVGPVSLNLDGVHVTIAGRLIPLALREMDVLRLLMNNAGRVLTRREILDACWESGYPTPTRPWKHKPDPRHPLHIRVVRGVGYVFDLLS